MSVRDVPVRMDTDRLFNSTVNFGINFAIVYGIGRRLRDHRTGLRAGFVMGTLSAVVSWVLWGRYEEELADAPAASDEVEVPVEEPSTAA
jgi:hypothetical protein